MANPNVCISQSSNFKLLIIVDVCGCFVMGPFEPFYLFDIRPKPSGSSSCMTTLEFWTNFHPFPWLLNVLVASKVRRSLLNLWLRSIVGGEDQDAHKSHLSTGAANLWKAQVDTCARLVNLRPKRCKDMEVQLPQHWQSKGSSALVPIAKFLNGVHDTFWVGPRWSVVNTSIHLLGPGLHVRHECCMVNALARAPASLWTFVSWWRCKVKCQAIQWFTYLHICIYICIYIHILSPFDTEMQ